MNASVHKVLEIVASELEIRECRIAYSTEDNLPQVLTDELQIQLVLVNILRNAMRSMATKSNQVGKLISIHVKSFTEEALCVSVEDQGPGISAERLEQVFEPMYSESGEGMGMGLAICRMIVGAHGGRIWCEENPSGGARFRFTLRVAPA